MVTELTRKGILTRAEDPTDRRRAIVSLADSHRPSIDAWLARGARAWRAALEPLTDGERELFVKTLRAYEEAI